MSRRWIAWGLACLNVLVFLVTTLHPSDGGFLALVLYLAGIASFSCVGALLWTRVPGNPIGPLLLAAGRCWSWRSPSARTQTVGALQAPPWPGADVARLIGDTTFIYPFVVALIGVPLVFPDGRLPSPRYRWVVATSRRLHGRVDLQRPPVRPGHRFPNSGPRASRAHRRRPEWLRARGHAALLRRGRPRRLEPVQARRCHPAPAGQVARGGRGTRRGRAAARAADHRCSTGPRQRAQQHRDLRHVRAARRDRDRGPPLPPVRDRPDRQPDDRLGTRHGNPRGGVRRASIVGLQTILAPITTRTRSRWRPRR